MSIDGIAAIIFVLIIATFLWLKRKQVQLQKVLFPILYVVMYRSSFGLKTMDWLGKFRVFKYLGDISVIAGFLGMILISAELIWSTVKIFIGEGAPGIQPVLPIEAKGVFFVPFIYWIISIFLLALVHEFSHGILARAHKIPLKSSGFAFVCLIAPIIPAAFVEPDEKIVQKRTHRQQLGMLAAGPISNLVFALLILGLFTLTSPALNSAFDENGIELTTVMETGPAHLGGLRQGDIIQKINNEQVTSIKNITQTLSKLTPGDTIQIITTEKNLNITLGANPENNTTAHLGIQAKPHLIESKEFAEKYGEWTPQALKWTIGLIFWLFMLNIGIGLFNLLPIGPLDGGRMFQIVCQKIFKKNAVKIWGYVSLFFIALIIANIALGFFIP